MPGNIKLSKDQLKDIIKQLNEEEKLDLARYLDELTLEKRWKDFLFRKKNIPISYEEVTKEVEKVRSKRYK